MHASFYVVTTNYKVQNSPVKVPVVIRTDLLPPPFLKISVKHRFLNVCAI